MCRLSRSDTRSAYHFAVVDAGLTSPLRHPGISIPRSTIRELARSLRSHPRPPLVASIYLLLERRRLLGLYLPRPRPPHVAATSLLYLFSFRRCTFRPTRSTDRQRLPLHYRACPAINTRGRLERVSVEAAASDSGTFIASIEIPWDVRLYSVRPARRGPRCLVLDSPVRSRVIEIHPVPLAPRSVRSAITHDVTWTWRHDRYGETDFLEERPLCAFRFRRVARQLTEVHANGTIGDRFVRFATSDRRWNGADWSGADAWCIAWWSDKPVNISVRGWKWNTSKLLFAPGRPREKRWRRWPYSQSESREPTRNRTPSRAARGLVILRFNGFHSVFFDTHL